MHFRFASAREFRVVAQLPLPNKRCLWPTPTTSIDLWLTATFNRQENVNPAAEFQNSIALCRVGSPLRDRNLSNDPSS
jgi:hypothetical protein